MPHLAKPLADGWVNLKQRDALELIETLSLAPARAQAPGWTLEWTIFSWERAIASWEATAENALTTILDEFRIADPPAFAEMRQAALWRHLLLNQARNSRLTADRQARLQALDRLRSRFCLDRRSELDEWRPTRSCTLSGNRVFSLSQIATGDP